MTDMDRWLQKNAPDVARVAELSRALFAVRELRALDPALVARAVELVQSEERRRAEVRAEELGAADDPAVRTEQLAPITPAVSELLRDVSGLAALLARIEVHGAARAPIGPLCGRMAAAHPRALREPVALPCRLERDHAGPCLPPHHMIVKVNT